MSMTIPGSEKFANQPLPRDELRRRIDPSLRLHTVSTETIDAIDPLTFEVIRHRLWAITEEMCDTLKRMSGSMAVTEANDFNFTICDELGEQVQVGLYNTGLIGSMDMAVFWTLEHRSRNPGIEPGDMFLCNDPWVGGGLHQNDAAILTPIFVGDELFGWTTAICHLADLGGASPGGYDPNATDVFSESLPTPPVKIVRCGVLQEDVADVWLRRSRVPVQVGLDLRAKIAASHTGSEQVIALVRKYGADTVKAVMHGMMDDAERRLRRKLSLLPDGSWEATGYQEQSRQGDRGLHKIALRMTKRNDTLIFDFTGTDPQAGLINCPYPGLRAGIMFTMMPVLVADGLWAPGGILRCIEIISEEGTLNNARFPAAVAKGPLGPAWVTGNLVAECLAKMLDSGVATQRDVHSVCAGTYDVCRLSGVDARGAAPVPFVAGVFDVMAAGFGADPDNDGVDTGGALMIPQGRAPDAEMTEYLYPLLVLWRREEVDSGGPGRQRGGVSGSLCVAPHRAGGPIEVVVTGSGKTTSQNVGIAGGYPGNSQVDIVTRAAELRAIFATGDVPTTLDQLQGRREVLACHDGVHLEDQDALYLHWQAGGGYGDPLLRDPDSVARDLLESKVSVTAAGDIYGVILTEDGLVDHEGTEGLRQRLRSERLALSGEEAPSRSPGASRGGTRLDDNLVIHVGRHGERVVACARCGEVHGLLEDSQYLSQLARFEGSPALAGPQIWPDSAYYVDAEVVFRQLSCRGCGTAVVSSVVPVNQPLALSVLLAHGDHDQPHAESATGVGAASAGVAL